MLTDTGYFLIFPYIYRIILFHYSWSVIGVLWSLICDMIRNCLWYKETFDDKTFEKWNLFSYFSRAYSCISIVSTRQRTGAPIIYEDMNIFLSMIDDRCLINGYQYLFILIIYQYTIIYHPNRMTAQRMSGWTRCQMIYYFLFFSLIYRYRMMMGAISGCYFTSQPKSTHTSQRDTTVLYFSFILFIYLLSVE